MARATTPRKPTKAPTRSNGPGGRELIIVESPTKARTVTDLLGGRYDVLASVGHVRDLPKSQLGVEVDDGFAPRYVIPPDKRKVINAIREAAHRAQAVFLATDPDREGEAISWHIVEAADLDDVPHKRVVFHEITPEGVREAFRHPRDIDMRLVDAQQARRVLDRLVGYEISPLLWQKIRKGLSAGRVQSVALRMVVEREREIEAFTPQEYWSIEAELEKPGLPPSFRAALAGVKGKKSLTISSQEEAQAIVAALRQASYRVTDVKVGQRVRRPAPPFTTSTLQQEASRRLGFGARRTMQLAQRLYEGVELRGEGRAGLITYMRTDSVSIADSARREIRGYITSRFGADFVPSQPRAYRTRTKGAQEAHEAIRPTSIRRDPQHLHGSLGRDELRLYTLIWQRTLASQMADAVYDTIAVEIEATAGRRTYLLRANRSKLRFPGFRQVYIESSDERAEQEDDERALPPLAAGDLLQSLEFFPEQHFTEPSPRYTEASLVKALEENGIGRPSTYAAILSTLLDREYVEKEGNRLKPRDLGRVVNDLLVEHFPRVFDVGFTAEMEEHLDDVARGERRWGDVVREFHQPLRESLAEAARAPRVEEETAERCELCGRPMVKKWGRYGQFLACTGYPECKGARPLAEEAERHEELQAQQTDERCDECGSPMLIKRGRFGPFLACSRYPECKGTKPLLRRIGVNCPKDGGEIVARQTRTGRTFYGCTNYPRCDFSVWQLPLPERCPNCGGLLVVSGRSRARCISCNWTGERKERERRPAGTAV